MKMSDGEKLIAVMLADIMAANDIRGETEPEFVKSAIFGDDLWALERKYHGLFHNEGPSHETVNETTDILQMCRIVEGSIGQLSEKELSTIDENDRHIFVGFDGNHDDHYGVAEMQIEHMNLWREFRERGLNSHSRVLDKYRRQLEVFTKNDLGAEIPMSLENIKKITEA